MKLNVKRICIFLALMLIAGSVFCGETIHRKTIGEFELELWYDSPYYHIILSNSSTRKLYFMAYAENKREAYTYWENAVDLFDYATLRWVIDNYNFKYIGEQNGWSVYQRDH